LKILNREPETGDPQPEAEIPYSFPAFGFTNRWHAFCQQGTDTWSANPSFFGVKMIALLAGVSPDPMIGRCEVLDGFAW